MALTWGNPIRVSEDVAPTFIDAEEPRAIPLSGDTALAFYLATPDTYDTFTLTARTVDPTTPSVGAVQTVWVCPTGWWLDHRYWTLEKVRDGRYVAAFNLYDVNGSATQEVLLLLDITTGGTVTLLHEISSASPGGRSMVHRVNDTTALHFTTVGGGASRRYSTRLITVGDTLTLGAATLTPWAQGDPSFMNGPVGLWVSADGTHGFTGTYGRAYPFTLSGSTVTFSPVAATDPDGFNSFGSESIFAHDGTHLYGVDSNGNAVQKYATDGTTYTRVDQWLFADPSDYTYGWGNSANRFAPRTVLADGTVVAIQGGYVASVGAWTINLSYDVFGAQQYVPLQPAQHPYPDFYGGGVSVNLCATANGILVVAKDSPPTSDPGLPVHAWWIQQGASVALGFPWCRQFPRDDA